MTRVTLALLVAIATAVLLVFLIDEALFVQGEPAAADICHVLAGPDYRTHYAIDLYQRGMCRRLLFIGGREQDSFSFAEYRRNLAMAHGVPAESIEIDKIEIYSSFSEIERLKVFINHFNLSHSPSVMMISDAYHMHRLRMVYSWIVGERPVPQLVAVPFEETPYPRAWWTSKIATQMISKEIVKILFYQVRYRFPSDTIRDWFARFDKIND